MPTTKAAKSKLPDGYTMQALPDLTGSTKKWPVRVLDNGAAVILDSKSNTAEARAFDHKGRSLGLFPGRWSAEAAAKMGYVHEFLDAASEISVWLLWNDAVRSGTRPLQDLKNRQVIKVAENVYLRLTSEERDWTVDWLDETRMRLEYQGRDSRGRMLDLRYADVPFNPR